MSAGKPTCIVQGAIAPRAMCSSIIVGMKYCGFAGECQHKVAAEGERALPELKPGQDWCCGSCGNGIVKNPKRQDFEYSREEFPSGHIISKTMPRYVAPCCGGDLMLWDEAAQDCLPWAYVDRSTAQEAK